MNSVERWLVFSLAQYRRALDMLVPISAPWAQVTLYYSSFYAANAVLGMFGGWIGHSKTGIRVVDVESGVAGSQELRIYRKFRSPSGATGSHRVFWDVFYDATASISAWAPADLASALDPVNNDFAWQINERNNVNYDMFHAWATSTHFHGTFHPAKLASLNGPPALQLEKTEQMIKLGLYFAKEVSLQGTALTGCGTTGTRLQQQKRLVTRAAPNLVSQSELSTLLEM
ncbi:MAG TPA: hypothetical protein VNA69_08155 [Thermoanaerobaculia bacterium]|nr:hypothetical protein [Thermoanaerobaculia bacterium]